MFKFIVSNEAENGEEFLSISRKETDNAVNTKKDLEAIKYCKIRIKLNAAQIP